MDRRVISLRADRQIGLKSPNDYGSLDLFNKESFGKGLDFIYHGETPETYEFLIGEPKAVETLDDGYIYTTALLATSNGLLFWSVIGIATNHGHSIHDVSIPVPGRDRCVERPVELAAALEVPKDFLLPVLVRYDADIVGDKHLDANGWRSI